MAPPTKYRRGIHRVLFNMERDMHKEFQELCWSERKTVSEKLNELIMEVIEKKALGDQTPINISYGKEQDKPSQSDIRQWLPREDAIRMAAAVSMDSKQWRHLGETCQIIARKIDTGYL